MTISWSQVSLKFRAPGCSFSQYACADAVRLPGAAAARRGLLLAATGSTVGRKGAVVWG